VLIAWIGTGTGGKVLPDDGPGLDQKAATDGSSYQRLDGWKVAGIAPIRGAEKTDSARDQWGLLCRTVTDRAKRGQNKNADPREPGHSGQRRMQYQSPHTATIAMPGR